MDFETATSFALKAVYSLRYEITCAFVMLILWLMGNLVGTKKAGQPTKAKAAKHMMNSDKDHSYGSGPNSAKARAGVSKKREGAEATSNVTPYSGKVDSLTSTQLLDAAWLVPQVTCLCRDNMQQALAIYRAAVKAGLKLQELEKSECRSMVAALCISAIRVGQPEDAVKLLKDQKACGLSMNAALFGSLVKLCTAKHLYAEALVFYDLSTEDASFELTDKSIWSCLLFCAIESKAFLRCKHFYHQLKANGAPSAKDYGNMVRCASVQGDWELSLSIVKEMQESSCDVDNVTYNTALATCVSGDQVDQARKLLEKMGRVEGIADVITYNTLMKGYAKAARMEQCFELFEELKARSIAPSQVTYGILLDACINQNQLDKAAEVFNTMTASGCPMNVVLYTTLIKGFARAGEVQQAMRIYDQMRSERSVPPDLITFSILIKANCDAEKLEEALKLLQAMLNLGLRPDEVVFNNLLAGCARQANSELGQRLYADMIASGIRPSNATFSILIRLYHQCKNLEEAVDMLRTEPGKNKVEPEPRLFLQLITACIRERQGRRAVEVYEMFSQRLLPSASAHSTMLTTCIKLNMYDTASEIISIAAARGARIDPQDCAALLEGAMKKRKTKVAADCAATMLKCNIVLDRKLLESIENASSSRTS